MRIDSITDDGVVELSPGDLTGVLMLSFLPIIIGSITVFIYSDVYGLAVFGLAVFLCGILMPIWFLFCLELLMGANREEFRNTGLSELTPFGWLVFLPVILVLITSSAAEPMVGSVLKRKPDSVTFNLVKQSERYGDDSVHHIRMTRSDIKKWKRGLVEGLLIAIVSLGVIFTIDMLA